MVGWGWCGQVTVLCAHTPYSNTVLLVVVVVVVVAVVAVDRLRAPRRVLRPYGSVHRLQAKGGQV